MGPSLTILGSGTSQGVPVIACHCEVCSSKDPKDNRTRASALISLNGKNVCIDTGPDFRGQMLREKVDDIEAVLFTHEHKDHLAGLDDVRAFNFKHGKDMPLYAEPRVQNRIRTEFHYAFGDNLYPGVPKLELRDIQEDTTIHVGGMEIEPIRVFHHAMPVFGFRVQDLAYITDANRIEPAAMEKLKGLKVLVLNALRKTEHISHFTLDQALEVIEELEPEQAYLTHISHYMGTHAEVSKELPPHVHLAYDGLHIQT